MPPPVTRRSRRRDVKYVESLDNDVLDSSPTARTLKKRKVFTTFSALFWTFLPGSSLAVWSER